MKLAECDILILPGLGGSEPGHWQMRWAERMNNAAIVEQADWFEPDLDDWVQTIDQAARLTIRPVIMVAHSLAVTAVAHAGSVSAVEAQTNVVFPYGQGAIINLSMRPLHAVRGTPIACLQEVH